MNNIKSINQDEFFNAVEMGVDAELQVFGILRGGHYFNEKFYYCSQMFLSVESGSSLKLNVRII